MSRLVGRDPFARTELISERVYVQAAKTCGWCGQVKRTPNGSPFLFAYTQESGGGRSDRVPGLFCSVGCMRSFHGD